jgi:cytochrome P450
MNTAVPSSQAGTTLDPARGPSVAEMTWFTSYQDVDEIFKSANFVQGGGGLRDSEPFVGHGLLSLSGDDHFERRRIEAALFRRSALRHYEDDVLAASLKDSFATCERGTDGVARGELIRLMRLALCRVSAALVGIDGIDTPGAVDTYLSYMDKLSLGVNIEWAARDHREIIRQGLGVKQQFEQELVSPSLRKRQRLVSDYKAGKLRTEELPLDLLTLMLLHAGHFAKWDTDVLLRELILFNGAATGTITMAVPHVVHELMNWLEAHPADRANLNDRAFLKRAVIEGIRLHPASPYLIRKSRTALRLRSGREVAAGEYVVLDLVKASRDPTVFGSGPDQYDPHRTPLVRIKPMGLAFGDGPHTCIGMGMTIGEGAVTDDDAPLGMAVYIVGALYRAGIRLDPANPPRWNDANVRNEYAAFPVCFDRL